MLCKLSIAKLTFAAMLGLAFTSNDVKAQCAYDDYYRRRSYCPLERQTYRPIINRTVERYYPNERNHSIRQPVVPTGPQVEPFPTVTNNSVPPIVNTVPAQFRTLDFLAVRLEKQSEQVHDTVHARFRNSPEFRHLDFDVADMEKVAKHIHEVVHQPGCNIAHLQRDVSQLIQRYNHVAELVSDMLRCPLQGRAAGLYLRYDLAQMGTTLRLMAQELQ